MQDLVADLLNLTVSARYREDLRDYQLTSIIYKKKAWSRKFGLSHSQIGQKPFVIGAGCGQLISLDLEFCLLC